MHFINHMEINIQNCLFIGCGGKGTEAVAHCRELVLQTVFNGEENRLMAFNGLRFAVIDSIAQDLEHSGKKHNMQTIAIASPNINQVIDNPDHPPSGEGPIRIRRHMPADRNYNKVVHGLPDARMGNSTCPPLGSMNFLASWGDTKATFRALLDVWRRPTPDETVAAVEPGMGWGQIFIAAGLYGGTGSGVHIHLAAMLRELLAEEEMNGVAIYGIFLLPDIVKNVSSAAKRKLRANAYACLKEIDHFMAGNPYILEKGTSAPLVISNGGSDVLFNKIFLVNDKNRHEKRLSASEAPAMIGELLFHYSCTRLGANINQRLVDDANTSCEGFAPEGTESMMSEKRRKAYSTFGLATTRIPYSKLKHNLTVDFAREVVNDLLLLEDHDTSTEKEKINQEIREKKAKYLQNETVRKQFLETLGLSDVQLNRAFPVHPPHFYTEIDQSQQGSIAAYMKKHDIKSLLAFCDVLRREVNSSIIHYKAPDNLAEAEERHLEVLKKTIGGQVDKLLSEGGPQLCQIVFNTVHTTIKEKINKHQQKINQDDARTLLGNQLAAMLAYQNKNKRGLFTRKKRQQHAENNYRRVRALISATLDQLRSEKMLPLLKKIASILEQKKIEIKENAKRFTLILHFIEQKKRPYDARGRLLDAVSSEVLEEFIVRFPYPAGGAPEDYADKLQKDGLRVNDTDREWLVEEGIIVKDTHVPEVIPVSDFPDNPEVIAHLLYRNAQLIIKQMGEVRWCKSFIESGLFPAAKRSGYDEDDFGLKIPVDAYMNTFQTLVKRSDPYLEYAQSEKFEPSKVTFVLLPSLEQEGIDLEKKKWESFSWPGNDIRPLRGGADVSPFSLTCLQFHFGLPLYSIDEIEEWKAAYEEILRGDDRPLHKFDLPMKEPYINVTGASDLTSSDITACFNWALAELPNNCSCSPIFLTDTPPILNALEKEACKRVYYELDEKEYIAQDKLLHILQKNRALVEPLAEKVKSILAQLKISGRKDVLSLLLQLASDVDKGAVIGQLIGLLESEKLPDGAPVQFLPVTSGPSLVFIDPCIGRDIHSQNILRQNFIKPLSEPRFKTGLDRNDILKELQNSPAFRDCFFEKCLQACSELRQQGCYETQFPEALRESEG